MQRDGMIVGAAAMPMSGMLKRFELDVWSAGEAGVRATDLVSATAAMRRRNPPANKINTNSVTAAVGSPGGGDASSPALQTMD